MCRGPFKEIKKRTWKIAFLFFFSSYWAVKLIFISLSLLDVFGLRHVSAVVLLENILIYINVAQKR